MLLRKLKLMITSTNYFRVSLQLLFLLIVSSPFLMASDFDNLTPTLPSEELHLAYQLADCENENLFYDAYVSTKNSERLTYSPVIAEPSSLMLDACDECPDLSFATLQGIAGYPQVSELSLCGVADTVSMLLYNAGECPLGNLVLTVNFDSGLAYGGFVEEQYGKTIAEFDVSDPSNPQFIITNVDSAEVYIMNFGISADCDVDFDSQDPLNFDISYEFTYVNSATGKGVCKGLEEEIGNFNNGIKVPVLNVLSVSPTTLNLTASNTPGCQNIVIRQDGLGAKLGEFSFDVCGHSPEYVVAAFRTAPDNTPITYTTDPVTGNLIGTIEGSHIANIGNGDEIMDANEQITVQLCYEAEGCLDDPMFLEYKATYGCNGKKCAGPSSMQGAVDFTPDFGANAVANASMVEYGGICGDNISFDMSITGANTDPLDGLWQDVSLKMNACLGGNISLVGVNMNGAAIPSAAVIQSGSTIEIDFSQLTSDPDGAGTGLEDVDGDGIFDDLPGGNTIDFDVEISIGCADDGSMNCNALACSISRIEVNGKRNCGQDFQQFANLSEPVNFFYGETSQANNEMMITGYSTPITEIVTTTANVWNPFVEGYTFSYEFGSENIDPCPSGSGNLYAVATVNANGNRINHLRYEAGSATYQGAPVAGVTWQYNTLVVDAMGTLDTTSITINIPAGDTANDPSHEYYFNLEAEGDCFPNDYMSVSFQVIEECDACGDPAPCKIIRSCNGASTYVDWNGIMCPCFIESFVHTQERTNYGYTDKTMTTKVDTSTIPDIDKQRYLPGDTMYVRQAFRILDAEQVTKGDGLWGFVLHTDSQIAAPVVPDFTQGMFKGWFVEKASTGVVTEIGVPTCLQDPIYDDVNNPYSPPYPSVRLWNLGVEGLCDASAGHGSCLTNPRINPNYPAEGVFNYGLTPLSVNHTNADRPAMYVYWGDDPECATSTDLAKNDCYEAFLAEWDFQDGDIIYIDYEAPMMHNPDYDLQQLNGTAFSTQGTFYGSMYTNKHNPDCKQTRMASSCNTSTQYFGHIPGPVEIATEVSVTDCDIQVSYDFNLSNLLPATGAGEEPWFANEIRNVVAVEYLEPQFPSNMVYLGDGTIRMPDGSVVPIPSANIDDTQGNLSCVVEGGVSCCVAEDATELMGLRINDDDYNVLRELPYMSGPSGPYETGNPCDVYGYTHKPNDPFPMFAVGGGVDCTWGMDFSLTALCPEDVESSDFRLKYQFADKYLTDLSSKAPTIGCGGLGMNVSTNSYPPPTAGTPYAGSHAARFPINPYATGDCTTLIHSYTCHYWGTIATHPDASPQALNPMRQTGELVTTPDNFLDNSADYPPLASTLANLLIADEGGASEFNTYEVCAGSVAGGATHMNVVTSITLDNSVDFLGVTDAFGAALVATQSSSTATTTTYAVVMPDIAPGECNTIIIETELIFCPVGLDISTDVCVSTVSGCLPPDKAAILAGLGEGCNAAGECYKYIADEADLQAEWQPSALPEIPLCSTIELETVIKNVKPANLVDIEPEWWFPAGLNFIPNSWEVCYQGGPNVTGPCLPIPDPTGDAAQNSVYGTYFEYIDDQLWSQFINDNGLPGSLSMLDSNFVKFRFEVETVCDEFISGTSIWFQADAADPCEQRVESMFVPSPPIIVEGANPADFAQFFVFADPIDANCGVESFLTLTYLNTSPIGVTDNSMVCMDIETTTFAYTPGSITMVSPASHTPTFTESTNGSITHVCFDIPDGIGPGQVFQTGFSFTVPEDISCGEQDLGVKVSSELMSRECMALGIECSVGVLNSVNPVININFLPPVTVESQDLRLGCSTSSGKVEVCYDVELLNSGDFYSNDIDLALIYDLDQNGQIDDYDVKLDSIMEPVLIPSGDTLMISGCFEVDADKSCPVFLMVMQETNCVCDAQDFYYTDLKPDLGLGGQKEFPVCPGEPFAMGYCGDWDYNVIPATGGTITQTADSVYVTLNSGVGEVMLEIQGTAGECGTVGDTITISSLMDFEIGPFSTLSVCSNACKVLNAAIPVEYQSDVTVEWVPSTYLDDPTSLTPTACNITDDITYTVIATFTSGDATCVFTGNQPIVVEDPVTTDLFEDAYICETDVNPLEAPAGKDNYFWYEVVAGGDDVVAHVGASFSPTEPGTYYLDCWSTDDVCHSYSSAFEVAACVDLAMVKTVNPTTPGPFSNGSTVTYDLTVYNQSTTVDVFNVYVKDYFPDCLVLNDVNWSLTTPATAGADGVAVLVSPIAFIPANGQQTRTITFTISPTCMSGPIINNSEISSYDDDNDPMTPPAPDEDSTPDDDAGTPSETGTDNNYDDDNPNMPGSADDPADSDDYDPEEIDFSPCPTIGGEVFVDLNNNGCQDVGDTDMVEGVEVTIWVCDPATGAPVSNVGSVTTGSDGQWAFGGSNPDGSCILDPDATYTATFDIPNQPGDLPSDPYVGYEFSTGTAPAGCVDGEDDNVDPGTGQAESCYDPDDDDAGDGDADENIDAGISPPCETIGGEVFVDVNDNGCQDAGETMMVEGAVATIWECDPATGVPLTNMGTDTTDASGAWSFGGVDPVTGECVLDHTQTYTVVFEIPNQSGDAYEDYEFSEGVATGACADGEADDVDPATGQSEQCYNPGDNDPGDGDDDNDIDAGITPPCQSIGGEVFVDANNNGCQDAAETTMVEGAVATVWLCNPVTGAPTTAVGTATTGADGQWSFGGSNAATGNCALDPDATYTVTFDIPNAAGDVAGDPYVGYELSTGEAAASCVDGESDDVDPGTGQAENCYDPNNDDATDGDDDEDIDAGITPCETMGGEVYVDANNNGCQDADETIMVEGAEVTIWTCDPVTGEPMMAIGTAITGADGQWSFGGANPATGECLLAAGGNYTVSFDIPNTAGDVTGDPYVGYELSTGVADASCVDGESDDVDPGTAIAEDCYDPDNEDGADGDDDENIDAGITPCETMGGEVFVDANNNGCQDADETTMVEGVEVTIWSCDPVTGEPSAVVGTATTGADGQWSFGGSDPATGECLLTAGENYTVSFDLPNAAGEVAGDPYLGYDFSTESADASCADGDPDDVDEDTGIAENCYDPDNEDGEDGDDDEDIDAGISPCESIGGEVFVDDNNNGCQEASETTPVPGVEVTVWSCDPITGDPVSSVGTATTGPDGTWSLSGADPATGDCLLDPDLTYSATFDLPDGPGEAFEGYVFSMVEDMTCAGTPDADDVDPATGESGCYDPSDDGAGDDGDEDIDAGIYPCQSLGGTVFYDENINGCQDNGETAVTEAVGVSLFECGQDPAIDIPVASTTTINGDYEFGLDSPNADAQVCLDANKSYFVVFDIPEGPGEDLEGYVFTDGEETCAAPSDGDDVDPETGQSECYGPGADDGGDDEDIDAGIFSCQNIEGVVFYDNDNNGCQEGNESVVTIEVSVTLYECGQTPGMDTPVASTMTMDGEYEFGQESMNEGADVCLQATKTYFVVFDLPNDSPSDPLYGYEWTTNTGACASPNLEDDVDPTDGTTECYNPSDEDGDDGDEHVDGGIYPCQELGGEVFYDISNNGCQETGDNPVSEVVTVNLFECGQDPTVDTPVATTNTVDGEYEFGQNADDPAAQICLEPGTTYFVSFDIPNGAGEALQGWGLSTNTEFCVGEGTSDDVDPATGNSECYDPDENDDNDDDDDDHIDAGLFECEDVGGTVFYDLNNNGCQDAGETAVTEEIGVSLYECNQVPGVDSPLASTTTIDGDYEFGAFSPNPGGMVCLEPAKEYFVVFDIPNAAGESLEHWNLSSHADACANPGDSDDVDPLTGQSGCYDPEDAGDDGDDDDDNGDGDADNHIDAGIYPCQEVSGEVFYDYNGDGCQGAEDGLVMDPVEVMIFTCGDDPSVASPIASTTTTNGAYEFGPESTSPNGDVCLDPYYDYFIVFDFDDGAGSAFEEMDFTEGEAVCANPLDSDDIDPTTGESECYDPSDEDGDGDEDIDAGIDPCEEIAGDIFLDENNNGCQDDTDTLITDPVEVSVYECGQTPGVDTPLGSTTTTDGHYEFSYDSPYPGANVCLDPAKEYIVVFDIPNAGGEALYGHEFSTNESTCNNPSDADNIDPTTGISECYDPEDDDASDGDGDEDIDAGIYPCQSMSGEIFIDLNNNGCQDTGETLVSDAVTVTIFECAAGVPGGGLEVGSTTVTDGMYEFGPDSEDAGGNVCLDPAKEYYVSFDIPQAPGDPLEHYQFSSNMSTCATPANGVDVDPGTGSSGCYNPSDDDGDDDDHVDAGIYPCQDLSGEIFLDQNNNGCEDAGEILVLEDVMVELFECDASGNPSGPSVASLTTNTGEYEFGPESANAGGEFCLDPAKTYYVQFSFDDSEGAPLQGHNFSGPEGACGDATESDDINPDTGESGCYNPNDDDGDDGDDDNHVDAGINPCQEIGGEVFYDIAGDGCEDGADTNVTEEVTVTLYECNGGAASGGTPVASTTTIDGAYMFGEESPNPGGQVCLQSDKEYYVVFDIPNAPGEALDNYVFTNGAGNCATSEDSDDVNDLTGTSSCTRPDDSDGDDDDHIDAGIMELACIGNFVWHDLDGNGVQDPGEPGLQNVVIRLYDSNGNIVSVTSTDSNGYYVFDRLYPGDYYLEFAPLSQYPLTTDPNRGGDTELDSDIDGSNGPNTTKYTTLVPGECDHSWDAGFYNCVPIGELVWYDVDMDNVWDDNENGINGLEVTLYKNVNGNWKKYGKQITGHKPGTPSDDGYYKFCAPPGEYYLHVDLPPYGLVPVRSDIGNDELRDSDFDHGNGPNTTSSFTVRCDEERCDIGAGFYPMATVGDIVWMDDNADGVRQPTEAFAAGVLVEAYDIYNDIVGSDVTDANGSYMIDYLRQEGYYLRIQPPAGYTVTGANAGSDESMDSDIDHSNGNYTTQFYSMDPGVHMPNVDAGLVVGVALPVELVSFTGQYRPDYVYLSWASATEINTEYFQIERRHESEEVFVSIGRHLSKGSDSKYSMNDYDVEKDGVYYYRLRSIDRDGTEQLSEVISVDISRDREDGVSIYPNPAVSDVNVELSLSSAQQVKIDIYDTQGKLMRGNVYEGRLEKGITNKVIDVKDMPAGVYNLQIQLGEEVITRRLILLKN